MQSFTQWLSGITSVDPALWLALAAGAIAIVALLYFGRRKRRSEPVVLPSGSPDWEGPFASPRNDERRRSIRRGGLPTPIIVIDSKGGKRARPAEAYVLDRSTGGIRLALEKPVPVGSVLLAKPGNAPEGYQWVKVTIRNCREVGDYFELGCQFETDLELSRLLMFG